MYHNLWLKNKKSILTNHNASFIMNNLALCKSFKAHTSNIYSLIAAQMNACRYKPPPKKEKSITYTAGRWFFFSSHSYPAGEFLTF